MIAEMQVIKHHSKSHRRDGAGAEAEQGAYRQHRQKIFLDISDNLIIYDCRTIANAEEGISVNAEEVYQEMERQIVLGLLSLENG